MTEHFHPISECSSPVQDSCFARDIIFIVAYTVSWIKKRAVSVRQNRSYLLNYARATALWNMTLITRLDEKRFNAPIRIKELKNPIMVVLECSVTLFLSSMTCDKSSVICLPLSSAHYVCMCIRCNYIKQFVSKRYLLFFYIKYLERFVFAAITVKPSQS